MRYIRYLFLAIIIAGLVVMAMANRQAVTLTVLPDELANLAAWNFSLQLPLFVALLGGVAVGLLLGYVLEWIREAKHRSEVAKRQRQVKDLNREVSRLKTEKHAGKDEVLAILDEAAVKKAS
ncbi:LapA family protein [Aliiruegeria haliotis]|nr:LapA family protein [Aliiruegeria haliotis]